MIDTPTIPTAETPATLKKAPISKKEKKVTGKPKTKASHPPTSIMVNSAIKNLKERGGSSLHAIKKYISSTYKVDAEKLAPFIRKAIKSNVASGALVQTKGKGASGSFKIASTSATVKKPAAKPKIAIKKSPAKKVTKAQTTKPKSLSKAKKTTKAPTKKPKSPKPKSVKKVKASVKK